MASSSSLALGEVPVAQVVMSGCSYRSIQWVLVDATPATFVLPVPATLVTSLSTCKSNSITLVTTKQPNTEQIMLKLTHDAVNMLPSILPFDLRWLANEMSQGTERDWILAMQTMTANAARIPTSTGFPLFLGVLVSMTTFPARLRVVILKRKRKHAQPQSDKKSK